MALALRGSTTDRLGARPGQPQARPPALGCLFVSFLFWCPLPFALPVSTRGPVVFQIVVMTLWPQDGPRITTPTGPRAPP